MAVIILQDGLPVDRKGRRSFVYAARVLKDGSIKIGVSGDLSSRLASIRFDKRSKIELIGVTPSALPYEKLYHNKLSDSRKDHEYYFDTPQIKAFISAHLLPAECYGLTIKCSQKPYRNTNRTFDCGRPNPANVARYIDRIISSELDQREMMINRLVMRLWHLKSNSHWPAYIEMCRDRLGLDLARSAQTYPYIGNRRIIYFDQQRLGVEVAG